MSKPLVIFPFGGNAREAFDCIEAINRNSPEWEVLGFLDDDESLLGKSYGGKKVLGGRQKMKEYKDAFLLAVPGNANNYLGRRKLIRSFDLPKERFATIIHPTAILSSEAYVGINSLIMSHVVISSNVKVGNHCVVLPNSVLSHDCSLGNFSCMGSNVSVSGCVRIEEECYVGSGVKIRENITIGQKSLLGLGSIIIKGVPRAVVVAGNPTRILRAAE